MSADVGVSGCEAKRTRNQLRHALGDETEIRGVDRIMADAFWRSGTRPLVAPTSPITVAFTRGPRPVATPPARRP